jgi:hypothetical protein
MKIRVGGVLSMLNDILISSLRPPEILILALVRLQIPVRFSLLCAPAQYGVDARALNTSTKRQCFLF